MNDKQQAAALNNCASKWRHPHRPELLAGSGWTKLDPGTIVDVLAKAPTASCHAAHDLLARMQRQLWSLEGADVDGSRRKAGLVPSVAVNVGGVHYRLHCEGYPRLRVVAVTV